MDSTTMISDLIQLAGYDVEAKKQLREYFAGTRREFTVAPEPEGSLFQKKVWRELQKIPYGTTITYKELACRVGNPNAARAVGGACHCNPIPILIPCHRVVAAHGKSGGFALGLEVKNFLLEFERKNLKVPSKNRF